MKRVTLIAIVVLGGIGLAPTVVHAAPIVSDFSCPVSQSQCNGNLYGWASENVGADTWQITLAVQITSNYVGGSSGFLDSIALKNFASSFSNIQLLSAPTGSGSWSTLSNELNANGCAGGNTKSVCFEWGGPGVGVAFNVGDVLAWTFQFTSVGPISDVAHIKYLYVNSNGRKVGDLGSFDITTTTVPEPGVLLLLGAGLLGLGLYRRRVQPRLVQFAS